MRWPGLAELEAEVLDDLHHEALLRRRYEALLTLFPDCRDPNHPGCPYCEDDEPPETDGEETHVD